jgi:hypothetical protein
MQTLRSRTSFEHGSRVLSLRAVKLPILRPKEATGSTVASPDRITRSGRAARGSKDRSADVTGSGPE